MRFQNKPLTEKQKREIVAAIIQLSVLQSDYRSRNFHRGYDYRLARLDFLRKQLNRSPR